MTDFDGRICQICRAVVEIFDMQIHLEWHTNMINHKHEIVRGNRQMVTIK